MRFMLHSNSSDRPDRAGRWANSRSWLAPGLIIRVAILFLAFGSPGLAQERRGAVAKVKVSGWSLPELQRLACASNPTEIQARASVEYERGAYDQCCLYPNPQIGYLQTNSYGPFQARASGVFFSQEFITAGKMKKSQAVQAAEIEHYNWNYEAQHLRILNDVELRFIDVLAIQESMPFADELVDIAKRELAETERRLQKKTAKRYEVVQGRMQLKTAMMRRNELQIQLETAWKQLAAIVGCADLAVSRVFGEIDGEVPELDWESCWATIQESNPLLLAAEARIRVASEDYTLERANRIPNLNLQVLADRDSIQGISTVSTLISAPLPIFNRNQGNIRKAAATTHEMVAERDRTRLALRDQLAETFGRYRLARAHVLEFRDELLPLAKENLDAVREEESDDESSEDLLAAERTFLEAQSSYVDAWAELRKTVVEIHGQLLTGALNPAEVGSALQNQSAGGTPRRNLILHPEDAPSKGLIPVLQAAP
jgi:cobalt-zinc-cadmium efflux system outer membrane protein